MRLKVGLMMVTLLTLASAAQADLAIIVGDHNLLPNTASQTVQIFLASDTADSAQGLTFIAQLGDGGPDLGGTDVTPLIQSDAVGPGTLFELNHNPPAPGDVPPSYTQTGFATQLGNVSIPVGATLLGTLIFDTTGFTSGNWPLLMGATLGGDTALVGAVGALSIQNGSITIVPEPSSIVLGMFAVAGFGAVAIRRRRARNA